MLEVEDELLTSWAWRPVIEYGGPLKNLQPLSSPKPNRTANPIPIHPHPAVQRIGARGDSQGQRRSAGKQAAGVHGRPSTGAAGRRCQRGRTRRARPAAGRRPQELGARPALRAAGRRRPGAVRLPASRDAAACLRLHCTPARGTPTASSQSGQGPGRQEER